MKYFTDKSSSFLNKSLVRLLERFLLGPAGSAPWSVDSVTASYAPCGFSLVLWFHSGGVYFHQCHALFQPLGLVSLIPFLSGYQIVFSVIPALDDSLAGTQECGCM